MKINLGRINNKSINIGASQSTIRTILAILISICYALLVVGISLIIQRTTSLQNPLYLGFVVIAVAILVFPIKQWLDQKAKQLFHPQTERFQDYVQSLSMQLTSALTPPEIGKIACELIDKSIHPLRAYVYLIDEENSCYAPIRPDHTTAVTEVTFPIDSDLALVLSQQDSVFLDVKTFPQSLKSDHARISLIDTNIFISLLGVDSLHAHGWFALRLNESPELLNSDLLNFLQTVANQTAIAIERSRVVNNLQQRMQEMNILSRISEGVNITLELDDILELVYFQTTQVIPADDFLVQLYDSELDHLLNLFIVEKNLRIESRENQIVQNIPQPIRRTLVTGNTILSRKYSEDFEFSEPGEVYNWMATPLKSADATIGVISLGLRDREVQYTSSQVKLLEAIAGQAAGAIMKSRLIAETNQRAAQFSALNEVSQQINATFNLDSLLNTIVQKAEDMLDSEAGSLLLFDEERKNLYFRVVTGPVAEKLLNKALASGTSIAWQTVVEKKSFINNTTLANSFWDQSIDNNTGFVTSSLLTAPLISQGEAIGVIEMINKRGGLPYNPTDQEILEALAGQAAIAIENARLYTQTDEALTARVEDLSIMQDIDRELNTSLDITRAMRITLNHAMRRTHTEAGFIGTYNETNQTVSIVAQEGYTPGNSKVELEELSLAPDRFHFIYSSLINKQPFSLPLNDPTQALLVNGSSQTVIPILRETSAIGVLVLESHESNRQNSDTMDFLTRLVDHASIAIYNSELYLQVQEANVAKSEFVSFVSHELKNPMTSIKGYTDLILANTVGPITDPQKNFLQTIRSNVERMDLLVSDLSDVSRIEAGRLRLDFNAIDLRTSINEVIRAQTAMLEAKHQQLTTTIPEDLPRLWVDRFRLAQILTNMISNANKYSPIGGVIRFAAEESPNQWNPSGAPIVVHMQIQDNGIGISDVDQNKIFTKFFRTEEAKTSDAPGTGLGLNITKNLIEMQGGQIWFESELGIGTTFHITLPVASG